MLSLSLLFNSARTWISRVYSHLLLSSARTWIFGIYNQAVNAVATAKSSSTCRAAQELRLPGHLELGSVQALNPLCEHFTVNENTDEFEFSHSSFAYTTKSYAVFFGRSSCRKYHLTLEIVHACMSRVPDNAIYPEAPPHMTSIAVAHYDGFFKGPMLSVYDELEGTMEVAAMLLQEAEICERLKAHPHPNLIKYYGCSIYEGRIRGLLFERYPMMLEEYLSKSKEEQDLELGFKGLRDGVRHLHKLSLAHNDIKPNNIMVSVDGTWILIDMGSCLPFGARLTSAGTDGWYDDSWTTSEQYHDELALNKLWTWLKSRDVCTQ